MKGILKRMIPLVLAITMMCGAFGTAEAARTITVKTSTSYKNYVTCTLQNKRKPGYVKITTVNYPVWTWFWYTKPTNTVRMTTTKGKLIWEGKNAIGFCGTSNFYLGKDHSAYRIYVKTTGNSGTAQYTANGNVTLK